MKKVKELILKKTDMVLSKLNNVSVSRKIYLFFAIVVGIPVIFLNFVFASQISRIYKQHLARINENNLQRIVNDIDYNFEIYNALLNGLAVNNAIQEILAQNENGVKLDRFLVNQQLANEFKNTIIANSIPEIKQITLYVADERFPADGDSTIAFRDIKNKPWMSKVEAGESVIYDNEKLFMIKKVYSADLTKKSHEYGCLMLVLDVSKIFGFDMIEDERDETIAIISKENELIFSSKRADMSGFEHTFEVAQGQYMEKTKGDLVTAYTKDRRGWTILSMHENSALNKDLSRTYRHIIILNIMLVLLIMCATHIFGQTFTKRLVRISRKMNNVEEWKSGNMECVDGNDEIAQIDKSFNSMLKKNEQLINEIYVSELEKKEIQIRALQLQINPHFLYNTLETINGIAIAKDCEPIPAIVQDLGDMFRYNIDVWTETVTFEDELSQIKRYLEIQKIRYDDKLEVYYDIDEEVYHCPVIKFVLQPIVENALCHGVDRKGGGIGVLEIGAHRRDGKLVVDILDNGAGMTPEKLLQIENILEFDDRIFDSAKVHSIGMKNVNNRIKLNFGAEYGISVKSKEKIGTKVTLTFPFEMMEE